MKKTIALIISVILVVAIFASCDIALIEKQSEDTLLGKNENIRGIVLGDTGYSLMLGSEFKKIDFFDVDNAPESYTLTGVYKNEVSTIIIYSGKTSKSLTEEAEDIYSKYIKPFKGISYLSEDTSDIEYASLPEYEYASFETVFKWNDETEHSMKASAIVRNGNFASIYYFVPINNDEEMNLRKKILTENIIKNK